MRWKAYWLIAWNTLKENTTYRYNTVTDMIFSTLLLLLQLIVWRALYAGIGDQPLFGRTLEDMMTYTIVVSLVSGLTSSGRVAYLLEERLKSGEIALDAMRPTSPRLMLVARTWGDKAYYLATSVVSVCVGAALVGGIQAPQSWGQAGLFVLALALGYVINLLFAYVTACLAFWFVPVNTLDWFISFFTLAMSGAVVPLWMLPQWLRNVALALPFQATTYVPVSIYMGAGDAGSLAGTLLVQLAWIAGLGLLQQLLWRRGIRRIVVNGG